MYRFEGTFIGIIIGFLCPFLCFIFLWWTSAALSKIISLPDTYIIIAALTGLSLGIIIDIFYLNYLKSRFYLINTKIAVLIYLFCSLVAVAFLMGLPFANILLGILGGFYIGRKYHHLNKNNRKFENASRKVSIFTAIVTGIEALLIGFIAIQQSEGVKIIQSILSLSESAISGTIGILIICILSIIIMVIQYLCTRTASKFAFKY